MTEVDASWWNSIKTVLLLPLKRQATEACVVWRWLHAQRVQYGHCAALARTLFCTRILLGILFL